MELLQQFTLLLLFCFRGGLWKKQICSSKVLSVSFNLMLFCVLQRVVRFPLHEMKAHYVPVLARSKATTAESKPTTTACLAPKKMTLLCSLNPLLPRIVNQLIWSDLHEFGKSKASRQLTNSAIRLLEALLNQCYLSSLYFKRKLVC